MAKFVLAGRADCPFYAQAELLSDSLQRRLPDFRVHKISVLPEEWEEWLQEVCRRNGWRHRDSPLVWRELVDQGGKGMLLGGCGDFLQHCKEFYGITSDMSSDLMLKVASENLKAQTEGIAEEQHRKSSVQPFHIWISSALSPTAHILIPHLVSSEVFPEVPTVSLHLLDLNASEGDLQALRMETQDLALPMLHQVSVYRNLDEAFIGAHVIVFLSDEPSEGGLNKPEFETQISERYRQFGELMESRADRRVKVIVSCDLLANLKCSLLVGSARSIDSHRFVAIVTQLENGARAVIAERLKVKSSEVTDVVVWGDVSADFHVDLRRARVFNYDGPVTGPAFFHQPVLSVLHDRKWLESDFQHLVRSRRRDMASKESRGTGMSAANGILTVLKAWNGRPDPERVHSLGVLCSGHFGLPGRTVYAVPVHFREGKWFPASDVTLCDGMKEKLRPASNQRPPTDGNH